MSPVSRGLSTPSARLLTAISLRGKTLASGEGFAAACAIASKMRCHASISGLMIYRAIAVLLGQRV